MLNVDYSWLPSNVIVKTEGMGAHRALLSTTGTMWQLQSAMMWFTISEINL